ncbi:MAG: response regulator [Pirellulales bacterium]
MSGGYVGRPMEILLVEDSQLDARLTILALRRVPFRYRLAVVRDGDEALRYLQHEGVFGKSPQPDVVLLDLLLPKFDGLQVLERLRKSPELQAIPVVVLSATDSESDRQKCQHLHVDQFMSKPVNMEKFLQMITDLEQHWQKDIILPKLTNRDEGASGGSESA